MKQKLLPLLLVLSLLLTGCGWMDGRYSSVTPHLEQRQNTHSEVAVASDYLDLMKALKEMIQSGSESGVINWSRKDRDQRVAHLLPELTVASPVNL